MSPLLTFFELAFKAVPKAAVAHIARQALKQLATDALAATHNAIAYEGEVIAFDALDTVLAKIEAGA